METVNLIASGYEWVCNECGEENTEGYINVVGTAIGEVKCKTCKTTFQIGNYDHCFSRE